MLHGQLCFFWGTHQALHGGCGTANLACPQHNYLGLCAGRFHKMAIVKHCMVAAAQQN